MKNQLVIGLGEIGTPLKRILFFGLDTIYGRDLQEPEDMPDELECIHICYPYSDEFVFLTVDYLQLYRPSLCIIHSTVIPGTTRAIQKGLFVDHAISDSVQIAYSPIRGRHGEMARDLLRYNKFYSGYTETAMQMTAHILEAAGFAVRQMESVSGLELAKLLETSYSGLLIAWAQEMARYCNKADVDYMDMVQFFSEIPYLPDHVFQPGFIGGHCIIPNLKLLEEFDPFLLGIAIQVSNEWWGREKGSNKRLQALPWSELK